MTISYTQTFLICPWCGEPSGKRVDHLFSETNFSFGPWYCDECGAAMCGSVTGQEFTVRKEGSGNRIFTRSLTLLKRETLTGPLYFVMDHDRYRTGEEAPFTHSKYYFEEHSCPTNWLSECIAVIEDGDTDPHGFLDFVRAIDVSQNFDDAEADWRALFPECFKKAA